MYHLSRRKLSGGVSVQKEKKLKERVLERAEHSAYGAYPETITYTLGKIAGAKNANLPLGDTYEDNAYTRYLKKLLNIQNRDVLSWKMERLMNRLWKWQYRIKKFRMFLL